MAKTKSGLTPMMRQYLEIKEQHQDSILFFRLGDFYEMFFEDAEKASNVLDIALTSRNKNQESSVPLCGIPYHSSAAYIRKLIENGFKVAICEQVEDPKQAKGIVKREVTRVITPGLLVDDDNLKPGEPNYLASFVREEQAFHLSLVDISTGEVLMGFYEDQKLAVQEIVKHAVKEILIDSGDLESEILKELKAALPFLTVTKISLDTKPVISEKARIQEASSSLNSPMGRNDEGFAKIFSQELLISKKQLTSPLAQNLLDRLLNYIYQTQRSSLNHFGKIQILKQRRHMKLDERTFRHLELHRNLQGEGRRGTLYWVLNQTKTAMGARRLMKWMNYPLLEINAIEARLTAVQELVNNPELTYQIQEKLKAVHDIERMLGKLSLGTVNARDLCKLGNSLQQVDALTFQLLPLIDSPLLKEQLQSITEIRPLYEKLEASFLEELPLTIREGNMIAAGVHPELDELRAISRDGKSVIAKMELQERERTGISSLKIRYNKVFGYYLEVTHTHRDRVPDDYIRKQTLTNAERYITPALKEYENKVLGAETRIKTLEYELFTRLRQACCEQLDQLRPIGERMGTLDVLASMAQVARENNYVRPELTEEKILELKDSRHPVLEKINQEERFIPNDILMNESKSLFLITGPNMAGKSTIMRQAALTILMAQVGSFVPAKAARVGLTDQLFTRIGASDDLGQGQSTFMVEMLETAAILQSATEKSFIILDEIGRGTSTFDGMSIAWAVAEFVAKKIGCRALFATHYHEMIQLADSVPCIANYQVAVKEWNDQILFLRKLVPGGASRSYGIEVARLAGLPKDLLERAYEVLKSLETVEEGALGQLKDPKRNGSNGTEQLNLFQMAKPKALLELEKIQPDTVSPIEALNFLFKLKEMMEFKT